MLISNFLIITLTKIKFNVKVFERRMSIAQIEMIQHSNHRTRLALCCLYQKEFKKGLPWEFRSLIESIARNNFVDNMKNHLMIRPEGHKKNQPQLLGLGERERE
jgi:hypothetical protein